MTPSPWGITSSPSLVMIGMATRLATIMMARTSRTIFFMTSPVSPPQGFPNTGMKSGIEPTINGKLKGGDIGTCWRKLTPSPFSPSKSKRLRPQVGDTWGLGTDRHGLRIGGVGLTVGFKERTLLNLFSFLWSIALGFSSQILIYIRGSSVFITPHFFSSRIRLSNRIQSPHLRITVRVC